VLPKWRIATVKKAALGSHRFVTLTRDNQPPVTIWARPEGLQISFDTGYLLRYLADQAIQPAIRYRDNVVRRNLP
jgi:hypothetical protein